MSAISSIAVSRKRTATARPYCGARRGAGRVLPHAEETSSSLLHRVRDVSDEASWREFVRLYEPLLLSYIRGRGLQEHDARDVVQEVFTRLHRALPTFRLDRGRGRFRTWLWQVASSALADWSRTQRRQARAEQSWRDQQAGQPATAESERDSQAAERRRVLERGLARVRARSKPKTWACFEQRVLRGRPSAEVAAELGLTPNAVNVNAARTLARLRKQCTAGPDEVADEPAVLPCAS
jgi:RNA polymerase sigma-70 factor (ECF subfamily)